MWFHSDQPSLQAEERVLRLQNPTALGEQAKPWTQRTTFWRHEEDRKTQAGGRMSRRGKNTQRRSSKNARARMGTRTCEINLHQAKSPDVLRT